MTRINIGIFPQELSDAHLLAEYRELPRVRAVALARQESGKSCTGDAIPPKPTLGTGHVLYFVNKGNWLRARWSLLYEEMTLRGFHPTLEWRGWPVGLEDGRVTGIFEARELLKTRILERINAQPGQHKWTRREPPEWVLTATKVLV